MRWGRLERGCRTGVSLGVIFFFCFISGDVMNLPEGLTHHFFLYSFYIILIPINVSRIDSFQCYPNKLLFVVIVVREINVLLLINCYFVVIIILSLGQLEITNVKKHI